ncbi:hypothetical protein PSPO01_08353 [Paraphaeosphaeria sporulosa]
MSTPAPTQRTVTMPNHADHFPFLQLPGELRNQVYREVYRLDEIPYVKPSRLHRRIPANGVDLLPILKTLGHIHGIEWRSEIPELGLLNMTLRTSYDDNTIWPCGRQSSSLTLQYTATQHTSEKKHVLNLCARRRKTGLRTLHKHMGGPTIAFLTPQDETWTGERGEVLGVQEQREDGVDLPG